ncbi:MAG TPA: hypothetical protein VNE59_01300 [Burkholderiales bacterium]|nr:hypothetical protein [Burkholderiales bacterium]
MAEAVRVRALLVLLLALALCWAAPLAGLVAMGHSVSAYLGFPPRTVDVPQAAFSWSVFVTLCLPVLATFKLYALAVARARPRPSRPAAGKFPWWGWVGCALIAIGWSLAWSRNLVPARWQRQSFTLLWLGYILALNGLARRRDGRSLLAHRTRWFLLLFPASAVLWWLFEYLNQFVANWYYGGFRALGPWQYFLQATLPFSTVLPAVASTWAWLAGIPRLDALALPALRGGRVLAWLALATGACGLLAIGLWPQALFPFLWLAPLLLLAGLQQLLLGETLFAPLAGGDWRPLLQPALAALVCGLFWELWNYGSLAKWHYSIPYVQRFHLFEMPLLGYAGYLPFGLECALVMDLLARLVERRGLWPLLSEPKGTV